MIVIILLVSSSYPLFVRFSGTALIVPSTMGTTVTFMLHRLSTCLARSRYFNRFTLAFNFTQYSHFWIYCRSLHTPIISLKLLRGSLNKFPDFFLYWALLLIVHTWNSNPLRSNLLRSQYTCCTFPTTSGRPHISPLVWACQWPSSQPLSSTQLSHNDSLWA